MRTSTRLLASAWLALLPACSASDPSSGDQCQLDPASQSIEVVIGYSFDLGQRAPEAAFSDRPDDIVRASGEGAGELRLFRSFASRGQALAFAGTFVVRVDGVEVGRASARTSDCDEVAPSSGLVPEAFHLVLRDYSIIEVFDGSSAGVMLEDLGTVVCAPSPRTRRRLPCDLDRRVLDYGLVTSGQLSVTVDGTAHPIAAVHKSASANQLFYELELEFPTTTPLADAHAELAASLDGAPVGSITASFAPCRALVSDPAQDPEALRYQQLLLTLEGGLQVDRSNGIFCQNSDGSMTNVIP